MLCLGCDRVCFIISDGIFVQICHSSRFISIKEEDYKFLLATAAPAFMVIPALICRPFGEVPKLCTLAEALS